MKSDRAKNRALRISAGRTAGGMTDCPCCGKIFEPTRRWQESCSRRCQLVYLAAKTCVRAFKDGRADGLRNREIDSDGVLIRIELREAEKKK